MIWKAWTYPINGKLWYLSFNCCKCLFLLFKGSKWLSAAVPIQRGILLGPYSQPRTSPSKHSLYILWRRFGSVSMFGLLRAPLVVPALPHKIAHPSPISPAPAIEGWFFWKCPFVRFGLCFSPWPFKFNRLLPRIWRHDWRSENYHCSCQRSIRALCKVL